MANSLTALFTRMANKIELILVASGQHATEEFFVKMRDKGWQIEDRGFVALPSVPSIDGLSQYTPLVRNYTGQTENGNQWGGRQWWRDACDVCGLPRDTIPDFAMRGPA